MNEERQLHNSVDSSCIHRCNGGIFGWPKHLFFDVWAFVQPRQLLGQSLKTGIWKITNHPVFLSSFLSICHEGEIIRNQSNLGIVTVIVITIRQEFWLCQSFGINLKLSLNLVGNFNFHSLNFLIATRVLSWLLWVFSPNLFSLPRSKWCSSKVFEFGHYLYDLWARPLSTWVWPPLPLYERSVSRTITNVIRMMYRAQQSYLYVSLLQLWCPSLCMHLDEPVVFSLLGVLSLLFYSCVLVAWFYGEALGRQ